MSVRDAYEYPKLRWPLDIRMQQAEGDSIIVISCPLGISEKPLALIAAVGPLLQEFQGQLSLTEIDAKLKQYGSTPKLLHELVGLLDEHLFLETPRFATIGEKIRADFGAQTEREPYLAGLSYAQDSAMLAKDIDAFLANGNATPLPATEKKMVGLMSPHIDYRRGGICYGITWNQLRDQQHDLYIVIGTAHQYSELMFHLTKKHFNTPLGQLPCDTEFVDALAKRYGIVRSFTDEFLHRREHSLELQTPFLRRLAKKTKIVPILIGSFHPMLRSGKSPSEFEAYETFAGALSELVREAAAAGKKVCVVAGVDMAHVGQQFGDKFPLSPESMAEIRRRDEIYLDAIIAQNKNQLWTHVEEDFDKRRICGFPSMYTAIDLFDRLSIRYEAKLFDYRQAVDYQAQCAVTFAGLGMYA